jgi:alpha-maltose-1-phosphate synthase
MILFGHPTGSPFAYNAALAHFERNRLEALCVPWLPTRSELDLLGSIPGFRQWTARFERRYFPELSQAPKVEGKLGEAVRLGLRAFWPWVDSERLSYLANDWLMRTMRRVCRRSNVRAVHAYEDCSLWQFEEAERLGKVRIYDLPIGYYPAWQRTEARLAAQYRDWLPRQGLASVRYVRPEQKKREMSLADIVLVPSRFVQTTIAQFHDKRIAIAPYGVDATFWSPASSPVSNDVIRFICVGHVSIRKGAPVLIQAWKAAALTNAELLLVGRWDLNDAVRQTFPQSIRHIGPCSAPELRDHYRHSDIFVFPSFFEGFGLVLLEAMACGLPALASEATAGPDIITPGTGGVLPAGDVDAWVQAFRGIAERRGDLTAMKRAARVRALEYSWARYRAAVNAAVDAFC